MKGLFQHKWFPIAIVTLLMLIGTFLRGTELRKTDLWYDEAFTGVLIRETWYDMFEIIKKDRVHPPLYYTLLKGWTSLFDSTSPTAIRSFSLVFGVISIPMAFVLIQQLRSIPRPERTGLGILVSTVLTISPFYIAYSVEARSYSFLLFLMLLSLTLFLRMIEQPFKLTQWHGYWIVSILLIVSTHYLSVLVLAGYLVALATIWLEQHQLFTTYKLWPKIVVVTGILWVGGTYLWSVLRLDTLLSGQNLGWIPQADLSLLPQTLASFLFGVNRQALGFPTLYSFTFPLQPRSLTMVFLAATIVVFTIFVSKGMKNDAEKIEFFSLASLGLIPLSIDLLASSLGLHVYVDRYVIGYGTFLIIFIAYGWWKLADERTYAGLLVYAGLLTFIATPPPSHPYTDALNATPPQIGSKTLLVQDPIDYLVFRYYAINQQVFVVAPNNGHYNWGYIPPSVEKSLSTAQIGQILITKKDAPSNEGWSTYTTTDQFAIRQKQE